MFLFTLRRLGSACAFLVCVSHSRGLASPVLEPACSLPYAEWRATFANELHYIASDDYAQRQSWYEQRCAQLDAWNAEHYGPSGDMRLATNARFGDRSPAELEALVGYIYHDVTGIDNEPPVGSLHSTDAANVTVPSEWTSLDWRDKTSNPAGTVAVTNVKNQGDCGACWSFPVIATLEAAVAIGHGVLDSYSEEELLDCDMDTGGCSGGSFVAAYNWLISNGGVSLYADYPWTGDPSACYASSTQKAAALNRFETVSPSCDVDAATDAIVNSGPLSISIDASCDTFMYYSGGVLMKGCGASANDHALTLVGFNVDADTPYWIAKNSWGTSWGDQGYIYISMSLADTMAPGVNCGISGVLEEAKFVSPDATSLLSNRTAPDPAVDDSSNSDSGNLSCEDVIIFGEHPFKEGDSGWACDAVVWLSSSHPWWCWVLVYVACFMFIICFCTVIRSCCAVVCRCMCCCSVIRSCLAEIYFCLCCCSSRNEDRQYRRHHRRRKPRIVHNEGLRAPLVIAEGADGPFIGHNNHVNALHGGEEIYYAEVVYD